MFKGADFQAEFSRDDLGREYSVFAVVRNPADQWPKYACYVIGIGLVLHFGMKLAAYLRSRARKAQREQGVTS